MDDAKVTDEIEPKSEASRKIARVRTWLRTLAPILLAIASSLAAYKGGDQSAKEKAGVAKDSAEAGYQGVDKWVTYFNDANRVLLERITKLETEVTDVKRRAKLSAVKRRAEATARPAPPAPAPVPALPPPPPPLAPNLDKALEQIQQQQKPAEPAVAPAK
jgi:hypothetical protein